MAIYIWLLYYNIAILCENGCTQVSMAHFNYLFGVGALELIFELRGIIKIYQKRKFNADKGPQEIVERKDK